MDRSFLRRLLASLDCFHESRPQPVRKASDHSTSSERKSEFTSISGASEYVAESQADGTEDEKFWWENTSGTLRTLLTKAEYSASNQDAILDFHRKYITGNFGPRPTKSGSPAQWRSFMTDDFSPMEWSWNWGLASKASKPTIRYSVEAIGQNAGSDEDPWNMKATLRLIRQFEESLPGFESSMFSQLVPRLVEMSGQAPLVRNQKRPTNTESPSSMFLAFDLDGSSTTVKVYFVNFKDLAIETGQTKGQLVRSLLMPLATASDWTSLTSLLDFGVTSDTTFGIEPFMVAWDCVAMNKNRIKIYFRSERTSFLTMAKVLSAHDPLIFEGNSTLQDLQELWEALFAQDPRKYPDEPLSHKEHTTAGLLYYYDVRPGSDNISPKVYLPIKHYGLDDLHTMQALCSFFDKRRPDHGPKWTSEYISAVENICAHRRLEEGLGFHTYVSCAVKNGSLDVTSYFNPEIYHASRITQGSTKDHSLYQ